MTERASGPGDTTFEPKTNFAVVRARQDLRQGNCSVGAMLTAVNRSNDRWSSAMLARQTDAVHYYQRPDAGLPLDSTRTGLDGDAKELTVGKVRGQHLMFESSYLRRSSGFEINDLGYLQRADQQSFNTCTGIFDRRERASTKRVQ